MILGAVGVSGRGGNTAVEYWLEISTFGESRKGATVLCLGIRAGAEGTPGGILATTFDMTKPPTVVALLGGGRRVGSFSDKVGTKDWDLGDVGQGLHVIGRYLHHDRKGCLVVEVGSPVGVEEAGRGDENGLGVEDRGLEKMI